MDLEDFSLGYALESSFHVSLIHGCHAFFHECMSGHIQGTYICNMAVVHEFLTWKHLSVAVFLAELSGE